MKHADVTPDLRPSRRTVTRAAAWTVPVVAAATAAPAYAASCPPVRIGIGNVDYRTMDRVTAKKWTVEFDPDGSGTRPNNVLTVEATYDKDMSVRDDRGGGANDNFTIQNPVGGLETFGLVMAQRATGKTGNPAAFGHYTFTFKRAVSNLSFTLTDIDSTTGDFWDSVWLTGTFTPSRPAPGIQGAGTQASPFRQKNGNSVVDNANGGGGNVTVTYPGSVTSFTLHYSNAVEGGFTADPDQVVTIANFGFDDRPC